MKSAFQRGRAAIRALVAWAAIAALTLSAAAESVTGTDWIVHFNLPDQDFNEVPGEYIIRDALLTRLNALQAGQTGTLAAYSFSADGTAGQILTAMQGALDRSARMRFIADYSINLDAVYGGLSLRQLANRSVNPLLLVKATNYQGIMHHKVGLFYYSRTNLVVFTGSWNLTTVASYAQWNITVELLNNSAVFNAYNREATELLAGRFHYNPSKSHAANGTVFRLAESWGDSWVDFAPYPEDDFGGTNALTEIVALISNAQDEIVFALNKLTRTQVRDALVAAADRGVRICGVIPKSDWLTSSNASYEIYHDLLDPAFYATTNRVHMITPYSRSDYSTLDAGEAELVHEKWMVIDPWGARPILVHGSANWTDAGLASDSSNDENVLFLRHRDLARWFYVQFKRMTRQWPEISHNWWRLNVRAGQVYATAWVADTNRCRIEYALDPRAATWTAWGPGVWDYIGAIARPTPVAGDRVFFRTRRY